MRQNKQGSVTVFLTLILTLLVALVVSSLSSVQMACARVQIASGADIGLYSLFAQYDKKLLEEHHLFYLDGSYGQGDLNLGKVWDTFAEYMEPILNQNYQNLSMEAGGITGYRLATDNGGESFRRQVVAYMRESLGTQGVQLLLDKVNKESQDVSEQQTIKENAQQGNTLEDYDQAIADGQQPQPPDEETEPIIPEPTPEPVENPIDTIREIQQRGILELVIQDGESLSQKTVDCNTLVSHRELQEGMGIFSGDVSDSTATERLLFQEYLLQTVGNYRTPSTQGQLSYPMEYIIGKNGSDVENLKSVAHRLLAIREGINFVYLLGDGAKRAQAATLAGTIATSLMLPAITPIVEMLLLACWAYGESLIDVRHLFSGGRVPLVKNISNWQLSLENLPQIMGRLDMDQKEDEGGIGYEDYLRVLLFLEKEKSQITKGMDVFELSLRGQEGHENFRMDSCMDALEVQVDVKANGRKTFTITREYGYQ